DPKRTLKIFSDAIDDALNAEFSGFRAAADMSWAFRLPDRGLRVIAYEAMLATLFATASVTGLCLYDRRRIPTTVMKGVLLTHPVANLHGEYESNRFFKPLAMSRLDVDRKKPVSRWKTRSWILL